MSCCTAGCPTCSEGGNHGLQTSDRPPPDRPEGREGVQRHLPLLHRRLRLQGLHVGGEQAGRRGAGSEQVRRRPRQAAAGRDRGVVLAVDVQHRPAERRRRPHRHQAGQGLRGEFGPRLRARRAHGGDELLARAQHPAATPHRSDGVALRPDAADELGRRARSRRARHRRGHQRHGRGRVVRLRLRPRRRRRRLREHLGHRQALFRRHEGEEHPHPQPAGLQFRGSRHPRHGRRRIEQLLRGRGACRHHRGGRHQRARNPDQLFPESLGAESARHLGGQETSGVRQRADRAGAHRHRRSAPHRHRQCLRGRSRQGPRDASRHQLGHRPRPVQRLAHLHRREGLDRQGVHRRLDQGLRQGRGRQQDEPGGGGADHRPDRRSDPPIGRMDRAAQSRAARGGGPCSPTRRA